MSSVFNTLVPNTASGISPPEVLAGSTSSITEPLVDSIVSNFEPFFVMSIDPASTSGGLIPEAVFGTKVLKTPLKQYYSKVAFSGGHDLSTIAVFDGKADAAFVATHRFMNTIEASKGKMKVEDFNRLWSSPLLPQDPFVYRSTLCPELKTKIQQTFLTLDSTPEGKKYLENVGSEKFVGMKDSDYDIIREAGVK